MLILVACEYSGEVRHAFAQRNLNNTVWSVDLLPTETKCTLPNERHYQGDVLHMIEEYHWDMMIAFPPCTDICSSGARWFPEKIADGRQQKGIDFFMKMVDADIKRICVENPIGIMSTKYRKPDQIIQPWQFGHGETKSTCLWFKNLPLLKPTNIVEGRENRVWKMGPSPTRGKDRAKTYSGIAEAMSTQWT